MKLAGPSAWRTPGSYTALRLLVLAASAALSHAARQLPVRRSSGPSGPVANASSRVVFPRAFLDGDDSDIAARAAEAAALSARLPPLPDSVGLVANASGALGSRSIAGANASSGLASGANASDAWPVGGSWPRIFFLFMTYAGPSNPDLWSAFFRRAELGRWRAFVHCKDEKVCRLRLSLMNPWGLKLVDSVPSSYCHDLVSPMVQLVRLAGAESEHPGDKFVFLSDTTLPVKPFSVVYSALTRDQQSDICIEPRTEWVWLNNRRTGDTAAIVKHSQWMVLSQTHARKLVERWPQIAGSSFARWSVPVWPASKSKDYSENDFGTVPKHHLCADEWAVFAALFGVVMSPSASESTPGLSSPTLTIQGASGMEGQGVCRTFVTWGESVFRESSKVARKLAHLLSSCFPKCLSSHPAHFTEMTEYGLQVLRSSSFLFARKFPSGVVAADQFSRVILAEVAPPVSLP